MNSGTLFTKIHILYIHTQNTKYTTIYRHVEYEYHKAYNAPIWPRNIKKKKLFYGGLA